MLKRVDRLIMVSLVLFALMFTTGVVNSFAYSQWRFCEVVQAGPSGGLNYIRVIDTAGDPAWEGERNFVLAPGQEKELLAVVLTAMSLGKIIRVQIPDGPDNNFAQNSVVRTVFLAN